MLFIFDWDGTLSDSKAKITKAMQLAAQDMGWVPLADHHIHNIIGLGLPEAIHRLYPEVDLSGRQRLRDAYATHFLSLDEVRPSDFFPGVMDTLHRLKADGHTLTIATGKSRKGLDRIFGVLGVADFFHATRCADETASKPDPLMLEELLCEFGVAAGEAVMIGDTEYDMEMARRIHMPRIAVSYGAHHVDRLHSYQPELCLDRFDQLLTWKKLAG
ncbi:MULTISPECIES: HAD-IA family hydrolase [Cellvibrio]|uniref:Phosphoglycolate phosphatase n=1 Tax=Cellvibrio fibrivorans TaxID=126350 RepID=A0ABU1UVJ9_9GAMM|nr:HAD-IA family hydrolase [Cellvibrio fibrivorans]MDR7089199.1 phosphoglycolate phosphatase [Cellvibrio fibrivorans]